MVKMQLTIKLLIPGFFGGDPDPLDLASLAQVKSISATQEFNTTLLPRNVILLAMDAKICFKELLVRVSKK